MGWDRSFFAPYPWKQICFSLDDPSADADSIADVVLQSMELFIPCCPPCSCRSHRSRSSLAEDSLAHTATEKADLLCTLFASNSTLDDKGNTPPTIPHCENYMKEIRFDLSTVRKALFSLNVHKSSGPDGIPAIVLRTCAPMLAPLPAFLHLRRGPEILENNFSAPGPQKRRSFRSVQLQADSHYLVVLKNDGVKHQQPTPPVSCRSPADR